MIKSKYREMYPEIFKSIDEGVSSLLYSPRRRRFSIKVLSGEHGAPGAASDDIYYCPFTGKKLPESLHDRWFDELERIGIDPHEDDDIPAEYETEEWWIKKGL